MGGKKSKEIQRSWQVLKENYTVVGVQTIPMWRIKSSSVPSNKGALKAFIVRNWLKITVEHIEIKSRQATN